MASYVYLLVSTSGCTYIGATVNLTRRLRQHNKEISGGAKATGIKVAKGELWIRAAHVSGFPDWQAALQFEWRWKQLSRMKKESHPLKRRLIALQQLISLDRPTSKAKLYSDWIEPCSVNIEDIGVKLLYDKTLSQISTADGADDADTIFQISSADSNVLYDELRSTPQLINNI